jgi:hypothetical protein
VLRLLGLARAAHTQDGFENPERLTRQPQHGPRAAVRERHHRDIVVGREKKLRDEAAEHAPVLQHSVPRERGAEEPEPHPLERRMRAIVGFEHR